MTDSAAERTGGAARPAPEAADKLERLKALLREMFQLDRGDLDFGLYRIMNMKAAEVSRFLDRDLLPQVAEKLDLTSAEARERLEKEIETISAGVRAGGLKPDDAPAVGELRARLAEMRKDAAAEADVYNHLADFFSRYYSEGDFVSQRRYSGGGRPAYLVPYDGEEVKLHWANADQFYIKTTENYAAYAFALGAGAAARRARFEVAAADNEKDAIKEANGRERRFVPARRGAVAFDGAMLTVRFEHRPLTDAEKTRWPGNGAARQARINADTCAAVLAAADDAWRALLAAPAPTEAEPERTLLARHVERYTAKNSFDYFIHKDLGGFLRRELDLYLASEVLNLEDVERGDALRLDRALARVRAIRHIGGKIVDFLAQLEEFQKRLWLKKKFVLEAHWCVTLDRVPEALYPEIAANAAQRAEWVALYAADEIAGGMGNGNPPDAAFLKANPFLIVDTRHFDRDFTDRLLAALSDAGPLDAQSNGLLAHGENFQALNLLRARYSGQVKCVYIDPPYNTDASAILYKNDYKHSSWLSLMAGSLNIARECMTHDGIICTAIDDEEAALLRILLQGTFSKELGIVSVRSNPAGRKSRGQFSPTHEYAMFYGNNRAKPGSLDKTERELARYPLRDDSGPYAWNNLVRHGSGDRRQDRPTMFYPIYVAEDDTLRVPDMEWDETQQEYVVLQDPASGEVDVWPVSSENDTVVEKRWHRGPLRVAEAPAEYRVRRSIDNEGRTSIDIDFKIRADMSSMPKTLWDNKKYASANLGPKTLKELFGEKEFDFAKSVALIQDCILASGCVNDSVILDYFAGSGTTGHAITNLNREDGGRRRFVLIEMADHFDTVLLPRMKKVAYSPDWKDGKPVSREGVTQVFKYVRLESYEDTMDSLEVAQRTAEQANLLESEPELAEDYRLRYALGAETAGSACLLGKWFSDPFAYTLSVVRDGARREAPVDLPETFNYLIGLDARSRRRIDGVLVFAGADAERRECAVLWRNLDDMDANALDAWFARNRARLPDSLDVVWVNGDHTLNAMRAKGESWSAETIEPAFRELMFAGSGR